MYVYVLYPVIYTIPMMYTLSQLDFVLCTKADRVVVLYECSMQRLATIFQAQLNTTDGKRDVETYRYPFGN